MRVCEGLEEIKFEKKNDKYKAGFKAIALSFGKHACCHISEFDEKIIASEYTYGHSEH